MDVSQNDEGSIETRIETDPKWMFWRKRRYVVATMIFFGFFNVNALCINLSFAMVPIISTTRVNFEDNITISYREPVFDVDLKTRPYISSSLFYGYIASQFLAGWLSGKIGGKRIFGTGVAISAIFTLLTPWLYTTNVYLLFVVQVLKGVFEGLIYPCVYSIWAKWSPPMETTRLVTVGFSGSYVCTVVSMWFGPFLDHVLGWHGTFYVFGVVALIWCALWWLLVAESPEEDPRISKTELEYIRQSLGAQQIRKCSWKKVLTSLPVWAIVIAHFTNHWGFCTLFSQLPEFMKDAFYVTLTRKQFSPVLPVLSMAIMIQITGHAADWLRQRDNLSTTQVRKMFTCCAFTVNAIFMVAAAFVPTISGSLFCSVSALALGVCTWCGFGVNALDIAPQHAAVLMGISNTFATSATILAPVVTNYIVTTHSRGEWQTIFCIAGGIYLIGALVYGVFASGDVQAWAVESSGKTEEIVEENKIEEDSV